MKNVELVLLDIKQGIDVCNWDAIKHIKADVFIHLANKSYVPDSYIYPQIFYNVNINSTVNILELARINKAKVIYLSSYVYGTPKYLPIDENHIIQAFNPYAQTKVICEEICRGYARDFKVPIIIFRPFNIYGKGQSPLFLLPMMIEQLKEGVIEVRDDRPKRDYIHVSDIIGAIKLAIQYIPENYIEIFNLGSGVSYSVKEVAQLLMEITTWKIKYSSNGEQRPNEILDTVADITKAKRLGWKPEVTLRDGLKELIIQND